MTANAARRFAASGTLFGCLWLAFPAGAASPDVPERVEITYRVSVGSFSVGEGRDVLQHDGKSYDLVEHGEITQSGALNTTLPDLDEGTIDLEDYGDKAGDKVVGSFDASFETDEGQTLQLEGRFKTELELVDL